MPCCWVLVRSQELPAFPPALSRRWKHRGCAPCPSLLAGECADVALTTLGCWLQEPGCPGKVGCEAWGEQSILY